MMRGWRGVPGSGFALGQLVSYVGSGTFMAEGWLPAQLLGVYWPWAPRPYLATCTPASAQWAGNPGFQQLR